MPVIVVGNISMGGTGKTPLVKMLGQKLLEEGFSIGIVSRGYGKYSETLELQAIQHSNKLEMRLKYWQIKAAFFIDKNRPRQLKLFDKYPQTNVILSDDGLQHYALVGILKLLSLDEDI